jgi:peroxiredoxin
MLKSSTLVVLILLALAAFAEAADVKTLEIGSPAPDFKLPGVDGKTYTLKDFASAKILIVAFICNHCPTSQAYEDRIIHLATDYKDKGVALVAINPNDPKAIRLDELGYTDISDTFDEMKIRAKEKNFPFPYLYDGETQATAHAYGVLATPQVFIFDQERKLRYNGRIDDSEVKEVHVHDAANAIEALIAGKAVAVEKARVFGCSTKWADKSDSAKKAIAKWDAEAVELKVIDQAGIKELARNDSKKLRLVNLWATWCGPCVHEMPELVTMNRMYRNRPFEMITISVDQVEKKDQALEMLTKLHVSSTNYLFAADDKDKLAEALDAKWEGPLPYTLLIAPGGKIIFRKAGEIDPAELKRAIVGYLGRTY